MTFSQRFHFSLLSLSLLGTALADPMPEIGILKAVGPEGKGNAEASAAWGKVVASGPENLMAVVKAVDGTSPVAANWLRTAAESLAEKALNAKAPLPIEEIKSFLTERSHGAAGRLLAYDLLVKADAKVAEALVPTFATDPVQALRRPATAKLIEAAKALKGAEALPAWKTALQAARDEDQIKEIAAALKDLGQPADLPKHFGFLMNWKVIGPFDNTGGAGFDTVFPPEKKIDLGETLPGKSGEVKWQDFASKDDYGKIDFNKPLGMVKEVTGYAVTDFISDKERPAELRLGCKNAWKVWLNGELLFSRDEYHRGAELDQYKMPCTLKAGKNTILVKACQNGQTEQWTVEWEFQLRVCDEAGTAIASAAQ